MSYESTTPARESINSWPLKLRQKAGIALGILALSGGTTIAAAAPQESHQLEYVGAATNQIWSLDLAQAKKVAAEIAATGANTVHIYEPLSPGQTEIENDRQRLCNAAEAARENNLTLEIGFIGYNKGNHGYIPSGSGAVTNFNATAAKIVWNIAGPNSNKPQGSEAPCVQEPLKSLIVLPGNEVNSKYFNAARDPAKDYAYLMSRSYPVLKATESVINQELAAMGDNEPLNLEVAAGGLTATQDAVGFYMKYNQDLKQLGVTIQPQDMLAIHPYSKDPRGNPADVESSLYGPLEQESQNSWGEPVRIIYDEFGNFAISATKRSLYGPKSLSSPLISDGLQGDYYRDALVEASQEPEAVGALIFQGRDDPNDGSPTGVISPDGTHKASWNKFATAVHEVVVPKN